MEAIKAAIATLVESNFATSKFIDLINVIVGEFLKYIEGEI